MSSTSEKSNEIITIIERFVYDVNSNLAQNGKLIRTLKLAVDTDTGDLDLNITEKKLLKIKPTPRPDNDHLENPDSQDTSLTISNMKNLFQKKQFSKLAKLIEEQKSKIETMLHLEDRFFLKVIKEFDYFLSRRIPTKTASSPFEKKELGKRTPQLVTEQFHGLPQALFFIKFEEAIFVGRKHLSTAWLKGKVDDIMCSRIEASMLLGLVAHENVSETGPEVYYHPLSNSEKLSTFHQLSETPEAEIYFPFTYLTKKSRCEITSDPSGWNLNVSLAGELGRAESAFRDYTVHQFLPTCQTDNATIYDPACSTGEFLHTIKKHYPTVKTVGQDLSQEMVDYAADFLDECYCADAINPSIPLAAADFIFCRFLNSEVVTTAYAKKLFCELMPVLKPKGQMIIFGHTPVLLNKSFFTNLGYWVKKCSAFEPLSQTAFQYYVISKP